MDFSKSYAIDARIEIHDILIKLPSTRVRPSIENLMEEIKAVVSEQVEFENRGESKVMAFFGKTGRQGTWLFDETKDFFDQIFLYECEVLD